MDGITEIKYKIDRKLGIYLEKELQNFSKMKWLAEQNKDSGLLEHCMVNINLLTQKLNKQKEVIKEISKQLTENKLEELEKIIKKEQKEVNLGDSFILDSESELLNSSFKTEVSSDLDEVEDLTERMQNLSLDDEFELN